MSHPVGTAKWLPVLLKQADDFKTPITGLSHDSAGLVVRFRKEGGLVYTATLTAERWRELVNGTYEVLAQASDLDTSGSYFWWVDYPGSLNYEGVLDVVVPAVEASLAGIESDLASIDAKLLASTIIQVLTAITEAGDVTLIRGDDYGTINDNELRWPYSAETGQDLTDQTVVLEYKRPVDVLATEVACEVENAGTANQVIIARLAAATTAALTAESHSFCIRIDNEERTILRNGRLVVVDRL